MEQDSETLAPGTRVGSYEIGRLIGRGGMGAVYEATHVLLRKTVALKALLARFATDAVSVRRFVQEGQAASRVGHEGIVAVTDVGVHSGVAFLVMELLAGESLGARLDREKRLGPEASADLIVGVCAALAAAHGAGVIHRDLKPENIFLTRDRRGLLIPKLVDFGISKLLSDDPEDISLTKTGTLVGTPHYMSPEQATGKKGLDDRVDQYALGVILYECVTGQVPFPGDNFLSVLHQIASTLPHPPRVLVPTLPAALDLVIQRAMAYERDQRFPSVAALGVALAPFASPAVRSHWEPELLDSVSRGTPGDRASVPHVAATLAGEALPVIAPMAPAKPAAPLAPVAAPAPVPAPPPVATPAPAAARDDQRTEPPPALPGDEPIVKRAPTRSAGEILGVYTGGVAPFSGLDAPRLKELLESGYVDPAAKRGRGPTAARLLQFMSKWTVMRAHGYAMSRRADDCEIALEGIECELGEVDPADAVKLRREFEVLSADADEYENEPDRLFARWD